MAGEEVREEEERGEGERERTSSPPLDRRCPFAVAYANSAFSSVSNSTFPCAGADAMCELKGGSGGLSGTMAVQRGEKGAYDHSGPARGTTEA